MRPVHKNNVKYLSGVSDWRARPAGVITAFRRCRKRISLKKPRADLTATSVYYHKSKPPLNGFRCRLMSVRVDLSAASHVGDVDSENDSPDKTNATANSVGSSGKLRTAEMATPKARTFARHGPHGLCIALLADAVVTVQLILRASVCRDR